MDCKEKSTTDNKQSYTKQETTNANKNKNANDNQSRTPASKQKKKTSWRYWHVSENADKKNMAKVTSPSPKCSIKNNEISVDHTEEVGSTFQTPIAGDAITSIEIFKDDSADTVLLVESSDDDEVVEIPLPPKPTILVDSSDEEEPSTSKEKDSSSDASLQNAKLQCTPDKNLDKKMAQKSGDRNPTCSSPVPSVVSSVSDDFIRGDCVALNISNKRQETTFDFDFNLHGTDLMDESRNNSLIGGSKKKKQKQKTSKNVESIAAGDFAKPKNKSKSKKQSNFTNKDIPEPDVYESDNSNQLLENISDTPLSVDGNDKSGTAAPHECSTNEEPTITSVEDNDSLNISDSANDSWMTIDTTGEIIEPSIDEPIRENFIIANVSGMSSFHTSSSTVVHDEDLQSEESFYKPELLEPGYEFSNPKVMEKHIMEMQNFYDQSWGGERFDHKKIIQQMPRDKSLWRIMPADRAPKRYFRGPTCNFCNQVGHRDDRCHRKPKKCYMCGKEGHTEPRCPNKICLNCGSPNHLYSGGCHRCASWARMSCNICNGRGHPATACPDTWRRYHRTLNHGTLVQFRKTRKNSELSCSGCCGKGHTVHQCNLFFKFSRFTVPTPYIQQYVPLYEPPLTSAVSAQTSTPRAKIFQPKKSSPAPIEVADLVPTKKQTNSVSKSTRQVAVMSDTPTTKKRCLSDNVSSNTSTPHAAHAPNFSPSECLLGTPKSKLNQSHKNKSVSETEMIAGDASITSVETPPSKSYYLGKRKLALEENTIPSVSTAVDTQLSKFDNVHRKLNTPGKAGSPMLQDNRVSNSEDVIKKYNINITQDEYNIMNNTEGSEYIDTIVSKYKLKTFDLSRPNSERPLYVIMFEGSDHPSFEQEVSEDVLSWLESRKKRISGKNKFEDDNEQSGPVSSNASLDCNLPKKRKILLELLLKEMGGLQNDLGDPKAIHNELLYLKKHHASLLKEKSISHQKMSNSRQKINKHLKALNMILLGQAGLADGAKCLNALYSITEQLQAGSNDIAAEDLRRRASLNYNVLFSAASRKDYPELVAKYYLYRSDKSVQKVRHKITKNNTLKRMNKKKQNITHQVQQSQEQERNFNADILKKVGFCTTQLRMMPVTSAPQNSCIRNYLGQLHFVWKHLHNRAASNQQEVHKHAHHLTAQVLQFLHSSY